MDNENAKKIAQKIHWAWNTSARFKLRARLVKEFVAMNKQLRNCHGQGGAVQQPAA